MKVITTATALHLASAIGASAMTSNAIIKNEVSSLGYSAEVIDALTAEQTHALAGVLYSGEDSDIRSAVRSLMLNFQS